MHEKKVEATEFEGPAFNSYTIIGIAVGMAVYFYYKSSSPKDPENHTVVHVDREEPAKQAVRKSPAKPAKKELDTLD